MIGQSEPKLSGFVRESVGIKVIFLVSFRAIFTESLEK